MYMSDRDFACLIDDYDNVYNMTSSVLVFDKVMRGTYVSLIRSLKDQFFKNLIFDNVFLFCVSNGCHTFFVI